MDINGKDQRPDQARPRFIRSVSILLLGSELTPICHSRVHKLNSTELLMVAQRYYIFTSLT